MILYILRLTGNREKNMSPRLGERKNVRTLHRRASTTVQNFCDRFWRLARARARARGSDRWQHTNTETNGQCMSFRKKKKSSLLPGLSGGVVDFWARPRRRLSSSPRRALFLMALFYRTQSLTTNQTLIRFFYDSGLGAFHWDNFAQKSTFRRSARRVLRFPREEKRHSCMGNLIQELKREIIHEDARTNLYFTFRRRS